MYEHCTVSYLVNTASSLAYCIFNKSVNLCDKLSNMSYGLSTVIRKRTYLRGYNCKASSCFSCSCCLY